MAAAQLNEPSSAKVNEGSKTENLWNTFRIYCIKAGSIKGLKLLAHFRLTNPRHQGVKNAQIIQQEAHGNYGTSVKQQTTEANFKN